jgi:hypothetical protein
MVSQRDVTPVNGRIDTPAAIEAPRGYGRD